MVVVPITLLQRMPATLEFTTEKEFALTNIVQDQARSNKKLRAEIQLAKREIEYLTKVTFVSDPGTKTIPFELGFEVNTVTDGIH